MPIAKNGVAQKDDTAYPLKSIYFYLTDECNLRCRHCWITPKFTTDPHSGSSLPVSLLESIIQQAKPLGVTGVKLTGGEPLLHPDFLEIIGIVRSHELGLVVETNGLLVTPDLADAIAQCNNLEISLSLDGTNAETHDAIRGVKGSFDGALRGIRALVETGLKPQIIMTLMKRNQSQVAEMVQLAESIGAGSVKFNILQPTARGKKIHHEHEDVAIGELVKIGRMVEETLAEESQLLLFFHWPMAFQSLSTIVGGKGNGCRSCSIRFVLGVLRDGSYALCGIGENVPELVLGHAERDRLEDVWCQNGLLSDIREGLPGRLEGICGDCLMKQRCLGACMAQNYYRKRTLWAPFWFCEEAHKKGLFPESRLRPDREILKKFR